MILDCEFPKKLVQKNVKGAWEARVAEEDFIQLFYDPSFRKEKITANTSMAIQLMRTSPEELLKPGVIKVLQGLFLVYKSDSILYSFIALDFFLRSL